MADVSIEVPSPLRECFLYCEAHCVRECCGINAISTAPDLIAAWSREAGPVALAEAQKQLADLVAVVGNRSHKVSSVFLNHYTCEESARRQLLGFLVAFHTGLAAVAESLYGEKETY
jgi:hypothetical protein